MSLPPKITVINMSRVQKVKGEVLLQFIAIFSVFLRGQALSITRLKLSFSYLAPKLWNNLPNTVREADTLCQFKSRLKTHLFNMAYTLTH